MRQIESWDYTGFASHEPSRDSAGLLARNVGICCPADFCPGPERAVALSPGSGPNPGDSRDRDPDIVPGQPLIPGQNIE